MENMELLESILNTPKTWELDDACDRFERNNSYRFERVKRRKEEKEDDERL